MDYFYTAPQNIAETLVVIDGDEFNHLVHVMRKKTGDHIRVVDGKGNAFDVTLEEMKKKTAVGSITSSYPNHNEDERRITLAVGVLKNPSRFDFLVEKAVELGVYEIAPLTTKRVIPRHAKEDRWQKLSLAAMKQSGRSYLPLVRPLASLEQILEHSGSFAQKILCHEVQIEQSITPSSLAGEKNKENNSTLLLIGPEGGFSEEEVALCLANNFLPLYLGSRRLRTETAAIAALALLK